MMDELLSTVNDPDEEQLITRVVADHAGGATRTKARKHESAAAFSVLGVVKLTPSTSTYDCDQPTNFYLH
jgi:hypothetical protein